MVHKDAPTAEKWRDYILRLPRVQNESRAERQNVAFGGINYGEYANAGELSESLNLSPLNYPYVTPRAGREVVSTYPDATAIFARGKLVTVDGTRLLYDGEQVASVLPGEKMMAVINTKLVIFPDKTYLDLENKEYKRLDESITGEANTVVFSTKSITLSSVASAGTSSAGYRWMNTYSGRFTSYSTLNWTAAGGWVTTGATVKKLSELKVGDKLILSKSTYGVTGWPVTTDGSYTPSDGYYCTITAFTTDEGYMENGVVYISRQFNYTIHRITTNPKLGDYFKVGDAVFVEDCKVYTKNNKSFIIRTVTDNTLTADEGTFAAGSETAAVTVRRKVPDFDCICERDNRLYGAAGVDIYVSALGDPTNFFIHADAQSGVDMNSYTVAVGTDGKFTGCIGYGGAVLFFKEDCLHKLLGNYPSNFEIYTYTVPGVQAGSHKSLTIINEVLYYKGRGGVYAYTGSAPSLVSGALGNRRYDGAVFGTNGDRLLYISMRDIETDQWGLFTYDTRTGLWLREDATHALDFACLDGVLYCLSDGEVFAIDWGVQPVEWYAEFAPFYDDTSNRKGYTKLWLRVEVKPGARIAVEVKTDGVWKHTWSSPMTSGKVGKVDTYNIPLRPMRSDSLSVRVKGKGWVVLRALEREFYIGSDK